MKIRAVALACMLWMGSGGVNATLNADPQLLAREVVSQSGVSEAIHQIPAALKAAVLQNLQRSGASAEQIERLGQRIDRSFDAEELTRLLEEHVLALMTEEDMQQVSAWLQSPLGRKIVAAEVQAGTAEGNRQMAASITSLMQQHAGSPREKLFVAYDRATHATEALVEGTLSLQLAVIAASLASEDSQLTGFDEIKRTIQARRGAMHNMLSQEAYASYLFTYRDLSLEELSRYIDFANSDVGSRYVQVLIDGVWEVITQRTEYFERFVADAGQPRG